MRGTYWEHLTSNRINRRRALQASGAGLLGAAFLAACGGGSDDQPSGPVSRDKSGLLLTPTDQSSQAKRGGTLNIADPILSNYEQSQNTSGSGGVTVPNVYSQLMRIKVGTYDKPPQGETEPEFAESYEVSNDGLTVTFRLRQGVKFDDRAPTNGRVADSSDVKYSWDRWAASNPRRVDLANAASKDAPVTQVLTPDPRTVQFKMAFPFAPFTSYMSSSFFPFIYPKEADGGFDTRGIARGTGAYRAEDNNPSGDAVYTRNPNYYHPNIPWFDKYHIHKLSEYSTISAQFRAGALDFHLLLLQEDVLQIKRNNNAIQMYQRPFFAKGCGGLFFGRRPGSVWNDERVRKALSMNIDRGLWGDTFSNRKKFEDQGLPVETKWHSGAGPGYHWWLDPEKNAMGGAEKNLKYDPAEAKKMLSAAGARTPINSVWNTPPSGNGGVNPLNEGMFGLIQQGGDFKFTTNVLQPDAYFNQCRNTGGDFEGVGLAFFNDHHDFDWTMFLKYHPSSTDFWMRTAGEDPKMTDFVNRQRRELDPKKRESIFQEFTKYDVEKMYYVPHFPADWKPYYIGQAWLGGLGWFQPYIEQYLQGPGQMYNNLWFDASKKS